LIASPEFGGDGIAAAGTPDELLMRRSNLQVDYKPAAQPSLAFA
jgi:hypothetical protein